MQEFMVDTGEWKAFWERWQDTVDQIPGMKEYLLDRIGRRVRDEVRTSVGRSGVNDSHGRVKLWQQRYIGSGKGYTAVRAESVNVPAGYRRKSDGIQTEMVNAGALTNFLVSGHRVRSPSGRWKRYKHRGDRTRVQGFDFYEKAKTEAEKISVQEAEDFLRRLTVTELKL